MKFRTVFSTIMTVAILCSIPARPSQAQELDLEKGLKIFQAIQEIQNSDKDKEKQRKKEKDRERDQDQDQERDQERESERATSNRSPSQGGRGGSDSLGRRVTGNWEYRSRNSRSVMTRVFGDDGRYVFRENGSATERGRWQTDADSLVLRPDGSRSASRLVIYRVDRSSMDAQFEADAEDGAGPVTWRRVTGGSDDDGDRNPGRPSGSRAPEPDYSLTNGFYRSPNNVTIEVKEGLVRIVENSRRPAPWLEPSQLSARSAGSNRIRFTHQGLEQIGTKVR